MEVNSGPLTPGKQQGAVTNTMLMCCMCINTVLIVVTCIVLVLKISAAEEDLLSHKDKFVTSIPNDIRIMLRHDFASVAESVDSFTDMITNTVYKGIDTDESDVFDAKFMDTVKMISSIAVKTKNMKVFSGTTVGSDDDNLPARSLPMRFLEDFVKNQLKKEDWVDLGKDCQEFVDILQGVDWSGTYEESQETCEARYTNYQGYSYTREVEECSVWHSDCTCRHDTVSWDWNDGMENYGDQVKELCKNIATW